MTTTVPPTTRIDEIADGIFRISTAMPPEIMPGGFTFNQFLIKDDEPLLFHTGPRKLFPAVRAAIQSVLPVDRLRHIAFSHFEADECGALNEFLAAAPGAAPLCGQVAAMTSIRDVADRAPRALADGEEVNLGRHTVRWLDAPHLPHAWECGHLFESCTRTLFCGDLFTQGGSEHPPVTQADILTPSLEMLQAFDYYSHSKLARPLFDKLAGTHPRRLACMHGASWEGDGSALLHELAAKIV